MKRTILPLSLLILLASIAFAQSTAGEAPAQQTPPAADQTQAQSPAQFAPGTIIPAELSKSVDAKKLGVGDQIEAKTTVDMLSNGQIVLPRNSKVRGHVTSVKAHSKQSPDSAVGIAFDHLVMKDGHELPLQASLQAVGAPLNAFGASSPTGGAPDLPASGPIGGGASPGGSTGGGMGGSRTGSSPAPSSYPSSGMPGRADGTAPRGSSTGTLNASSQGVVGIRDLSLSSTAQASVLTSSTKNVHLDGGTQLILRVQ